jgi:N-methylhydantoinase A
MANAAKIHVAEKGKDARRYTLLAFGGAGPVHAWDAARRLGMRRVVVPLSAGVFSALGLLLAPLSLDLTRTYFRRLDGISWPDMRREYDRLERRAAASLVSAGGREADVEFVRSLDIRYVGQGYEINVPLPGEIHEGSTERVLQRFYAAYTETFGRHMTDVPVEIVNLRLNAVCSVGTVDLAGATAVPPEAGDPNRGRRKAFFHELGGYVEVPVFDHRFLPAGFSVQGPAIVEQRESTSVVGPGDQLRVDSLRNLVLDITSGSGGGPS